MLIDFGNCDWTSYGPEVTGAEDTRTMDVNEMMEELEERRFEAEQVRDSVEYHRRELDESRVRLKQLESDIAHLERGINEVRERAITALADTGDEKLFAAIRSVAPDFAVLVDAELERRVTAP